MVYKKEISEKISRLLRYEWDPIGLGEEGPYDEYEMYASSIIGQCGESLNSTSVKKLTNMLHGWETKDMGLTGDKNHCQKIAEKILEFYGR